MNAQSLSSDGKRWQALAGMLFVAFFIAGDVLRANLAPLPLPLPTAPAADVVQYYQTSGTAALAVGIAQALSAISLVVFVGYVAGWIRRMQREGTQLPVVTRVAGMVSAALLLVCALLGLALMQVTAGGDLELVATVRTVNVLSGGTLHIASLGVFVGVASLAVRQARSLPRWISWWGIVLVDLNPESWSTR
jgi:hypothetical protein